MRRRRVPSCMSRRTGRATWPVLHSESMEQGQTFRSSVPRFATTIPTTASGSAAQSLHALLLLHPRRDAGVDGDARGLVLSLQTTCYLNGHNFIEKELDREKTALPTPLRRAAFNVQSTSIAHSGHRTEQDVTEFLLITHNFGMTPDR